jgi:ketosteroid isomerase-like protein
MNANDTNTMSDPKVQAVQRMYQAFGRGDVEAVLAELAEDVEWISVSETPHPLVPWYGRYAGTAEVPRFFKEIGSNVDVTEFSVLSVTASETDVMVAIRWAFTVRATGRSAALHMQHWWRFAGGKVVFARTAEDSGATAALFS